MKRNLNSDETLHPPDETAPAADQTLSRAEENLSSAEVTLHIGNQLQDPGDGSPDLALMVRHFLFHLFPGSCVIFLQLWFHFSPGHDFIFLKVLV